MTLDLTFHQHEVEQIMTTFSSLGVLILSDTKNMYFLTAAFYVGESQMLCGFIFSVTVFFSCLVVQIFYFLTVIGCDSLYRHTV